MHCTKINKLYSNHWPINISIYQLKLLIQTFGAWHNEFMLAEMGHFCRQLLLLQLIVTYGDRR